MRSPLLALSAWLLMSVPMVGGEPAETIESHRNYVNPLIVVRDAVNLELTDVARALRSIDQSYAYRGMRGTGSWTAGSAFMDWEAQGVPPEHRWNVTPPPELNLAGYSSKRCGIATENTRGWSGYGMAVKEVNYNRSLGLSGPSRWGVVPSGMIELYVDQPRRWVPAVVGQVYPVQGRGLNFSGGHIYLEGAGSAVLETCRPASRFSFGAHFQLAEPTCCFTPLVLFGDCWSDCNLCLGQLGNELRFRWKTDIADQYGAIVHELCLGQFDGQEHIVRIDYAPGNLKVRIDQHTTLLHGVSGDLDNWSHARLTLGSTLESSRWRGSLFHVALGDHIPVKPPCVRCWSPALSAPTSAGPVGRTGSVIPADAPEVANEPTPVNATSPVDSAESIGNDEPVPAAPSRSP